MNVNSRGFKAAIPGLRWLIVAPVRGSEREGKKHRRRGGNVEKPFPGLAGETDLGQASRAPGIPLRRISLPDIVMSTASPARNGMRRVA